MNILKIKRLNFDARTPTRSFSHDCGLDIYASETVVLRAQEKRLLSTGIAVDIPPGYVGLLTSRSGVSIKTSLVVETGKIDAGYNGEMKVIIKNDAQIPPFETSYNNFKLDKQFDPLLYRVDGKKEDNNNPFSVGSGKDYIIKKGDKIAQLLIVPIITPDVEVVKDFEAISERSENGFGSTGY